MLSRVSNCLTDEKEGFPKNISVSIGFSIFPDDNNVISEVLHLSDRALYASKQAGRNCYRAGRQVLMEDSQSGTVWPIKVYSESLVGRQKNGTICNHIFLNVVMVKKAVCYLSPEKQVLENQDC